MESAKSKNPRDIKPISDVANQQSHAHLSSCGFHGEDTELWGMHKNAYGEQWKEAWFWRQLVVHTV